MKTRLSFLCGALAMAFVAGGPAASAGAVTPVAKIEAQGASAVVKVQDRRDWRRDRRHDRRHDRFERRGNYYYYNGHRGYRSPRRGWREYNGWWFPPAAFALGVIIGNEANRGARGYPGDHYAWCESRYRSYRMSDNTFQPYHGPRQQCISPFIR